MKLWLRSLASMRPQHWMLLIGLCWSLGAVSWVLEPVQVPLWAEAVPASTTSATAAPSQTKTLVNPPSKRKQRRRALWSILIGGAILLGAVGLLWWTGELGLLGLGTFLGILLTFSILAVFVVLLIVSIALVVMGVVLGKPAGLFVSKEERKVRDAQEKAERAERLAKVQHLSKRYIRRYIRLKDKFKTVQELLPRRREELAEDYAGATGRERIEYRAALAELDRIERAYQEDIQEIEAWNEALAALPEADRSAYQKLIESEDYWKGRVEYHGERSDLRGLRLYQAALAKLEAVQLKMAALRGE